MKVTTDRYLSNAQSKGAAAVYRKPERVKYKCQKRGDWYDVLVYTSEKGPFD